MTNKNFRQSVLEKFLNFDLDSPEQVFNEFLKLESAKFFPEISGSDSFVYVPGSRKDRVLLVAHADTVFHKGSHTVIWDDGKYRSLDDVVGIGADDRAGCAILWLLKDMGHSLLVTNGEEIGCRAAHTIKDFHKEIFEELNNHQYVVEFDRRNGKDYKFYNIPVSSEFSSFIKNVTDYEDAGRLSSTDITVLCDKICGVNLSIGYYYEHHVEEYLVFSEWENTLNIALKMLKPKQKKYLLESKNERI